MDKASRANMTEGPFLRKIIFFTFPLAAASMLQLLFNAADVVVVGRYAGDFALAAVSSTGSLVNLLVNVLMGLSVGCNVVSARFLGAKDDLEVSHTVQTSIFIAIAGGLFMAVVGVFAARPLLELMSSPPEVIDLTTLYLRIYFAGLPVMMLYNFGSALLRSIGDTSRPLICLAASGVVNVILNLIFVIRFQMSVAGVALATVISQGMAAAMVLAILVKEQGPLHLDLKAIRMYPNIFRQIAAVGLPAGLQGTVFSLSNVVIQSTINSFGPIIMAGNGAAANIESFVYAAMNSCYQACITFTSQNMGARKLENINRILRTCLCLVFTIGIVLGGGAYLMGHTLLGFYSPDPAVIEAGMARLAVVSLLYAICGGMDTIVGSLRGMGASILPMIVSLVGSCALRLVYIATIFQLSPTPHTLYLCYPITWTITLLAHVVCFVYVRRKVFAAVKAPNY